MNYVIGVDPSSQRLAVSVLRDGRAVSSEWRPLPEDKSFMCFKAMKYIDLTCRKWGLKAASEGVQLHFFIEEPVVGRGGAYATIVQAKVNGACLAGAIASGHPKTVETVNNSTWKKNVLGSGNYPKNKIGDWLKTHWPAAYKLCDTPDEYDAMCIAAYGNGIVNHVYDRPDRTARRKKNYARSRAKKVEVTK